MVMKTRSTLLWGDINSESAKEFVATSSACAGDSYDPIFVYIHSDGGDVDACAAIIDQISLLKKRGIKVVTIGQGKCYSSGAIILAHGSAGHRYATKNTGLMLHPVSIEEMPPCSIGDASKLMTFCNLLYGRLLDSMYKQCCRPGKIKKKIFANEVEKTLWMTPEVAITYGLIDSIWNGEIDKYGGETFSNNK